MGAGELSNLLLFFTLMGYSFRRGWAPGGEFSDLPDDHQEAIAGVTDITDMSVLKTLFDIDYDIDGTIPITIKNVYKIVNGMFELVGVKIPPEDALECLMTYNSTLRDEQL